MPVPSRGALCPGMQMRAVGGRGKSPKSGSAGDTDRKSAHSLHVLEESPGWTCFVDGARGNTGFSRNSNTSQLRSTT